MTRKEKDQRCAAILKRVADGTATDAELAELRDGLHPVIMSSLGRSISERDADRYQSAWLRILSRAGGFDPARGALSNWVWRLTRSTVGTSRYKFGRHERKKEEWQQHLDCGATTETDSTAITMFMKILEPAERKAIETLAGWETSPCGKTATANKLEITVPALRQILQRVKDKWQQFSVTQTDSSATAYEFTVGNSSTESEATTPS